MLLLKGEGKGNIVYNLRENYMLYLSGQKRGMSELKCISPVILTSECPKITSSPERERLKKELLFLMLQCRLNGILIWFVILPMKG